MPAIACPNCSKRFIAPENTAGRKAKCTRCGRPFVIEFLTEPISFPTFELPRKSEVDSDVDSSSTDCEISTDLDKRR